MLEFCLKGKALVKVRQARACHNSANRIRSVGFKSPLSSGVLSSPGGPNEFIVLPIEQTITSICLSLKPYDSFMSSQCLEDVINHMTLCLLLRFTFVVS